MSDTSRTPRFDALLAHQSWVRALAFNLAGGDAERADDLVQDTWLAALRRGPRTAENLRGWLRQVMQNLLRQGARGDARREHREVRAARPEATPSTEEIVERAALHRRIVDAVWALDEPYRNAVILRYFEDLPPREVAERLGVNVHTARTRIERARERLRGGLDRHYGRRAAWAALVLPGLGAEAAAAAGIATGGATIAKGILTMKLGVKLGVAVAAIAVATVIGIQVASTDDPGIPTSDEPAVNPLDERFDPVGTPRAAPPNAARSGAPTRDDEASSSPETERAAALGRYSVSGAVTDLVGKPISGAAVRAYDRFKNHATPRLARSVVTDENGAYRLGPIEKEMLLEVTAEGFHRMRVIAWPRNRRDFRLGRPGMLTGRIVHEEDEAPCVGAVVALFNPARRVEHDSSEAALAAWAEAETDGNGVFRFTDLPPGRYRFTIYPRGANRFTPEVEVDVTENAEARRDLVLPHLDAVTARGRVIDRRSGRPIEGAVVYTRSNDRRSVVTDAEGRYEIRGISEYRTLCVEAKDYRTGFCGVHGAPPLAIEQEIALDRAATVRGRVIDPDGRPVENACVAFQPERALERNWKYPARTDGQGRFHGEAPPGTGSHVYAAAEGFAPAASEWLEFEAGHSKEGVLIRLARGAVVSGRVTGADATAVDGMELRLVEMRRKLSRLGSWVFRTTVENGTYAFTPAPAGRYRITTRTRSETLGEFDLEDGGRVQLDLDISRIVGTLAIEGRVRTPDGKPVSGVTVVAQHSALGSLAGRTRSDAEGRFRFDGLKDKDYLVYLQSMEFKPMRFVARAGNRNLVLDVIRKPTLKVRVVRADTGAPVERFWYTVATYAVRRRVFASDGRHQVPASLLRHGILTFGTEDGWIAPTPIAVPGAGALGREVEVRLVRGGSVMGRVIGPDGRPVERVDVRVLHTSELDAKCELETGARSDAAGRFAMRPLPPGRHRLRAKHEDWIPVETTLEIATDRVTEPVIRLQRGGALRIRVLSPTGEPIQSATLNIERADGRWNRMMSSGSRGQTRIPGLASGEYVVSVRHGKWSPAVAMVNVLPGADTPLDIPLGIGGSVKVTAVDSSGLPVTGADVTVKDAGGKVVPGTASVYVLDYVKARRERPDLTFEAYERGLGRTDAQGVEVRDQVPPGRVTVTVTRDGFEPLTVEANVAANLTTAVSVTLKPKR